MPVWMILSLLAILVLYVWGYFGYRRSSKFLYPSMLWVGAALDWIVSLRMAEAAGDSFTVHGVIGFIGLFGMSVFAFLALIEYRQWKWRQRLPSYRQVKFNSSFGLVALVVWLGSLVTGLLMGLRILPRV